MFDGLIYNDKEKKNVPLPPDTPLHGAFRRTVQRTGLHWSEFMTSSGGTGLFGLKRRRRRRRKLDYRELFRFAKTALKITSRKEYPVSRKQCHAVIIKQLRSTCRIVFPKRSSGYKNPVIYGIESPDHIIVILLVLPIGDFVADFEEKLFCF